MVEVSGGSAGLRTGRSRLDNAKLELEATLDEGVSLLLGHRKGITIHPDASPRHLGSSAKLVKRTTSGKSRQPSTKTPRGSQHRSFKIAEALRSAPSSGESKSFAGSFFNTLGHPYSDS